jgi:hypothetical protein
MPKQFQTTRIKELAWLHPGEGPAIEKCSSCMYACCAFGVLQKRNKNDWKLKVHVHVKDKRKIDLVLTCNGVEFASCYLMAELLTANRINKFIQCTANRYNPPDEIPIDLNDLWPDGLKRKFAANGAFMNHLRGKEIDCFPGLHPLIKQLTPPEV